MQRDLFDDNKRDTIGPERDEQAQEQRHTSNQEARAAQKIHTQVHAHPRQHHETRQAEPMAHAVDATVVEAEVIEEFQPARPHEDAPTTTHERLALIAFVMVLLGSVFLLHGQTQALQATSFAEAPAVFAPVDVRYPHAHSMKDLSQDDQIKVSFAKIVDNAETLRKSAIALNRPKVANNKVLSQTDYLSLKHYLADREGITNESDVRDLLLQAGYTLPPRLPDEEAAEEARRAKHNGQDHVAFAKHVISKLLKDEVEDFLGKVQLASEVGVYVAETAEDE